MGMGNAQWACVAHALQTREPTVLFRLNFLPKPHHWRENGNKAGSSSVSTLRAGGFDCEPAGTRNARWRVAHVRHGPGQHRLPGRILMAKRSPVRFDEVMLPHLDAAYNLARWLSGSPTDADDVVQEAFLRAFRFFDGYKGDNPRAWLLAIVRNTWFTAWRKQRHNADATPYDDSLHV